MRRALAGGDSVCTETIECFCGMLGAMASDLALTLARPAASTSAAASCRGSASVRPLALPRALRGQGPLQQLRGAHPDLHALTAENLAFHGVSSLLADRARPGRRQPLLERVRARESLSPAERRVANFVLDNPRTALNDPIALIAQGAEVSQPTVIRFCRSLGFQGPGGLQAQAQLGLTGTLPVQRSQVRRQDSTGDLPPGAGQHHLGDHAVPRDAQRRGGGPRHRTVALRQASSSAMGNSAVVALDAQHKLFRFRISPRWRTDGSMLAMASELLGPDDVAVSSPAPASRPNWRAPPAWRWSAAPR